MDTNVIVTPQFDLCFALADLASPQPHFSGWPGLEGTPDWLEEARSFGWGFWIGLPDLAESPVPKPSTAEFVQALSEVPPDTVLPRLRRGLLHVTDSGKQSSQTREWLHF